MIRPAPMLATLALTPLALAFSACTTSKSSSPTPTIPSQPVDQQPVSAQQSSIGVIDLTVTLRDDGLLLNVGALPAGATLECQLDSKPLNPCHDGALYGIPSVGIHKITAVAQVGGVVTALGESKSFTVATAAAAAAAAVTSSTDPGAPMTLVAAQGFTNGMTVPMTKDFVASFLFAGTPSCATPQLQCKYDSRTSQFWTVCDAGNQSFTVGKDLLALGLQYLSVQATCSGQAGPVLTMFWYGVPDGYKPMMLKDLSDSSGRHILNLVKADDCPESQQQFQCAATAQDAFTACSNGNVVDQPAVGYQVRLACGSQFGPALTLLPAVTGAVATDSGTGTGTATATVASQPAATSP